MTTTSAQTITRTRQPRADEPRTSRQGHSRLGELAAGPWALTPDMLREVQAVYEAHLHGPKIDIAAVEARLGRPLANEQQRGYEVQNGVALIGIDGVLAPKMNFMMQISGGSSTRMLEQLVVDATADQGVRSIILEIDSPGGSVFGTPELAQAVRDATAKKPVVALVTGVMASAAYWVGSAANAIYATGPTVMVGSIGVLTNHTDQSGADAKAGIKRTEVVAGKYKRIDSDTAPLSTVGTEYLQARVDEIYRVFVETVAKNRGASVEAVLEHMADGRVFIGQQAIDAGLVDGVSTLDALIAELSAHPETYATRRTARIAAVHGQSRTTRAGAARAEATPTGGILMDPTTTAAVATEATATTSATIKRDHPAIAAEFMATGAAAELERAKGVRATMIPGHEALVEAFAADGKTTPGEAALQVLAAERGLIKAEASAHAADAPGAAAAAPKAGAEKTKDRTAMAAECREYTAQHGGDYMANLKKLNPGVF